VQGNVEFKFVVLSEGGEEVVWETRANRELDVGDVVGGIQIECRWDEEEIVSVTPGHGKPKCSKKMPKSKTDEMQRLDARPHDEVQRPDATPSSEEEEVLIFTFPCDDFSESAADLAKRLL